MKIFVNARFLTQPLSGVQRYGIECSRQIKKLYPETIFVAPKNLLHKDIAKELNVITTGVNTGHLWEQIDLPFYLAKKGFPPLLNLANTGPLLYSNSFITIHDLAFYHHPEWNSKKFSAWYNILIPRLAYKARHIFTVSNTVRKEIVTCYGLPASKITVAYNGISQNMLSADPATQCGREKIILSIGTFNIRKNHQKLVAAFLNSKIKNEYQLVIIGDRNKVFKESTLDEELIKNSNIKIYDTLNEAELLCMYQKAMVVVSLSMYEGFGIPLIEGLYNGCRIICSDIPVYRELYNDVAIFCDQNDLSSVINALHDILSSDYESNKDVLSSLFVKYDYALSAKIILEKILQYKF